jgi:hypothetical protein
MRKKVKEMEGIIAAKDYEIALLTQRPADATVLRMVEIKEEILRERECRAAAEEENLRLLARIRGDARPSADPAPHLSTPQALCLAFPRRPHALLLNSLRQH